MESNAKLQGMTDEQIIEVYDREAAHHNPAPDTYLQILATRAQDRQTKAMLKYTRWITVMTIVMTLATILNVWISFRH